MVQRKYFLWLSLNIRLLALSIGFLVTSVTHLLNGALILSETLVFALPLVAVISPVTRIYTSE